jgi:hypothetical protein
MEKIKLAGKHEPCQHADDERQYIRDKGSFGVGDKGLGFGGSVPRLISACLFHG